MRMVSRLIAEESLQERTIVAMGTGAIKPEAASRIESRWLEATGRRQLSQVIKRPTAEQLESAGIGVVTVKKDG
jgi:hypothetical protein